MTGMTFPLRWTVKHAPYTGLDLDELNNEIPAWDDWQPVKIYGWFAKTSQSFGTDYRSRGDYQSRQTTEVTLTFPVGLAINIRDHFELAGVTYEVDEIRDPNHGFHGWQPGMVAVLRRITPKGRP